MPNQSRNEPLTLHVDTTGDLVDNAIRKPNFCDLKGLGHTFVGWEKTLTGLPAVAAGQSAVY